MLVDYTGVGQSSLAKSGKQSEDGRHSRSICGARCDGPTAPMTARTTSFWFEDIYGNKDIVPSRSPT